MLPRGVSIRMVSGGGVVGWGWGCCLHPHVPYISINKCMFHVADAHSSSACPSVRLGTSFLCKLLSFHSSTPWRHSEVSLQPESLLGLPSTFRRSSLRCHLNALKDVVISPLTPVQISSVSNSILRATHFYNLSLPSHPLPIRCIQDAIKV